MTNSKTFVAHVRSGFIVFGSQSDGAVTTMTRKRQILSGIVLGALLLLTIRFVLSFRRYQRVQGQFELVQVGDSKDSVDARLGKPNYYSGACGVIHIPDKRCALEYVYSHPFAPLLPEYYIVSFSAEGHLIEADQWDSP